MTIENLSDQKSSKRSSEMQDFSPALKPMQLFPVCGTWGRVGALALDFLIIMSVGFGIIYALDGYYGDLALYDRWIGLIAMISYFGICNSKFGNGQTPGKRLLQIQVVDKKGHLISLTQSLVRSLILLSPFFIGHIVYPYQTGLQLYNSLVTMLVITLSPGLILYYFFNKRTRQSLHDFVVHSYVIRKKFDGEWAEPPLPKQQHLNKAGLLMALSFLYSIYQGFLSTDILNRTFSSEEMNQIQQIHEVLNNEEDYAWGAVTQGAAGSYLVVKVIFRNPPTPGDWENKLEAIARQVREVSPLSKELKVLVVQGYFGMNIGCCQVGTSLQKTFTPEYWYSSL